MPSVTCSSMHAPGDAILLLDVTSMLQLLYIHQCAIEGLILFSVPQQ